MDSHTTNKSERNINTQFDQRQFNAQFEKNESVVAEEKKKLASPDLNKADEIIINLLPHQRPIEDNIILLREMFYKILEILVDKQNPIPYILSTPDRQFGTSILLITVGSLLLLFSNLMQSPKNI